MTQSPAPEAPAIRTKRVDPLPFWKTGWRKIRTFLKVAQKKRETTLSQREFIASARRLQKLAEETPNFGEKTTALWKLESLGFSLIRHSEQGNTLHDPELPIPARPITHVGLGAGAVELARFEPAEITRLIESYSDPHFRLFPYESLGAMLAMHEPSMFPIDRYLLGLDTLKRPDPAAFIEDFSPEVQRLISHGYGRLLYFKNRDIGAAVRAALQRPYLRLAAATQGTAFGYMMVNNQDLYRVLDVGEQLGRPDLVEAFTKGLVYALQFWEWLSPGCLATLLPTSERQSRLIEHAQSDLRPQQERGWLKAFSVSASGP